MDHLLPTALYTRTSPEGGNQPFLQDTPENIQEHLSLSNRTFCLDENDAHVCFPTYSIFIQQGSYRHT